MPKTMGRESGGQGFSALGLVGALLFFALAVPMVWGGALLIGERGSPYYLIAGVALLAVAWLILRGREAAIWLYAALVAATILWALAEVGLNAWSLLPRIFGPALLGLWFAIPAVRRRLSLGPHWRGAAWISPVLFLVSVALIFGAGWRARFTPIAATRSLTPVAGDPAVWDHFGGDEGGGRFANASLITPANAGKLQKAWTYRTGDTPPPGLKGHLTFEATPLKIDDVLYVCTPTNTVVALDADSGRQIWRTALAINPRSKTIRSCRGLAYHAAVGSQPCAQRILMGTIDDRLVALDSKTGALCKDFGNNGVVDMSVGLGYSPPGYHLMTSPPTVVRDVAVVGAFVLDGQSTDEPSGVIRAYDVTTGQLRWAWDGIHAPAAAPLKAGQFYPRSSPNSWGAGSADEALGLVYIPTGNPTPDFWGGKRTPDLDRYGSSIVALDAATGNVRWSFKTVNHDLWDYDVGAQPVLVDLPNPGGGTTPALLAPTKRGEIFVLDRRTGQPLVQTVDKPAPRDAPPGDWQAPMQPYSVGFPSFTPPDLKESSMWGLSPLDQLWCRLAFHHYLYEGQFTPNSVRGSIHFAGNYGVIDWGSIAVDRSRRIVIVNSSWFPFVDRLIPRAQADAAGLVAYDSPPRKPTGPPLKMTSKFGFPYPQIGTPFAATVSPFVSLINLPCHAPPWGALTAIDLDTRKVLWSEPLGATRGRAPFGIELPIGTFNLGGSVTTAGGVTFIGAAIDNYLRAFDTATGRELWKAPLPAGGQANPMTYVSKRTGRQYVVIAAGGHSELSTPLGDYVVAYALPTGR